MAILDGKGYRDELLKKYKNIIEKEELKIRLDIILVGNDPASLIYVKNKLKFSEVVGVEAILHHLDDNVTEKEVIDLIENLNQNEVTTGIILQSPTPHQIDFDTVVEYISPKKDVDGLVSANILALYHNREKILPCTVRGILELLNKYSIDLKGKSIAVVGRGDIVGKPLILALQNRGATVTSCDEYTKDLKLHTRNADIIISAVGKKDLITKEHVKPGFIGVDVGITRVDGKIYGDFDYENIHELASFITPVPGGAGPMTIAMIIGNLIDMKRSDIDG